MACLPWYYEQLENNKENGRKKVRQISYMMLVIFSTFAFISSLFMKECVVIILSKKFLRSIYIGLRSN